MKERDRRDQLTDEAQRAVDVERQVVRVDLRQELGESNAVDMIRDDRQRGVGIVQPLDAPDSAEGRMTEPRQAADALTQGKFEGGHRRQLASKAQPLVCFTSRWVDNQTSLAEAVAKDDRGRRGK